MSEDDDTLLSALRAGAAGYLLKGSGAQEVHNAIRAAAADGMVFGASLAGRVAELFAGAARGQPEQVPFPDLTDRERSVLDLLAAGRTNDQTAAALFVSSKTVRNTVSSIYAKLHTPDRAAAIIAGTRGRPRPRLSPTGRPAAAWSSGRQFASPAVEHPPQSRRAGGGAADIPLPM